MSEEDGGDLCPVCVEPLTGTCCELPGCNHRFHVSCIVACAQYDARCPVCRAVPDGVAPRRAPDDPRASFDDEEQGEEEDDDVTVVIRWHDTDGQRQGHVTHRLPPTMVQRLMHGASEDGVDVRWVSDAQVARREWQRYAARRRRLMRQRPELARLYTDLRALRSQQRREFDLAERVHIRKSRLLWRDDPEVGVHRRAVDLARRRELRLERRLRASLDAVIGPPPPPTAEVRSTTGTSRTFPFPHDPW